MEMKLKKNHWNLLLYLSFDKIFSNLYRKFQLKELVKNNEGWRWVKHLRKLPREISGNYLRKNLIYTTLAQKVRATTHFDYTQYSFSYRCMEYSDVPQHRRTVHRERISVSVEKIL